jgi:hypothetical protein
MSRGRTITSLAQEVDQELLHARVLSLPKPIDRLLAQPGETTGYELLIGHVVS